MCQVSAGFPFRKAISKMAAGKVFVVQMQDVEAEQNLNWEKLPQVELPSKRNPSYLRDGDILFTTRGGRHSALAISNVPSKAVTATNLFVLRVSLEAEAIPEFVAWQINQRPAQRYFASASTGTHIKNITRPALEQLPFKLPPIEKQIKIVELAQLAARENEILKQIATNRHRQIEALASQILKGKAHS